jgi:cellulose synthase/poly-beta-1,6-N-acetylglucosamine synthase-like glycosyltransferase
MLEIVFWVAASAVVYTYVLYPALLYGLVLLGQVGRDVRFILKGTDPTVSRTVPTTPRVSLIIAAHNEEAIIGDKLLNSLALDYPANQLEILVASDGSTDRTNDLVRSFARYGVRLLDYPDRPGKIGALSRAVAEATGDVVVLSDANPMYRPDALQHLLRPFSDPQVGAVCGEIRFIGSDENVRSEGMYWRYEVTLKRLESQINSVLGANGAIYALRRELYETPPDYIVADDFVIPMRIRARGYRVVYEPLAVALEEMSPTLEKEFSRKARIGAAVFQAIPATWSLLNPCRGFIAFAYWSHKILRWLVPFFLLAALITSVALASQPLYAGLLGTQLLLYLCAFLGHLCNRRQCRVGWLNAPYYFSYMNLALLFGFVRFLRGQQKSAWENGRRKAA